MYTCTKFQQYITNNRLVVVKYSSAIFSLSLQKSEKWPKVKGQFELFRLQSAHEGSLHIRFYFYFNWLWNSEYFWVLCFEFAKKCAKKGDLCKKIQVVFLFSTSMIQCAYCADLHVVWTFWWFWQLIFWIFFIQFNSEVKVKGHGGIFRYRHLDYGVMYICTKFQPDITTNMEVVLKFSPTTLSLQKCAKSYKKVQKKCDFFSCKNLVLNPHFRKKNSWES